MGGKFGFGAVVKWTDFEFDDGGKSNKLLIVLGAKPGQSIIAVLTTTSPRGRPAVAGCYFEYVKGAYYFAKGLMPGSFTEDTWVELYRPQEIDMDAYLKREAQKKAWVVFNLRPDFAAGIRNCLKRCPDMSAYLESLLQ